MNETNLAFKYWPQYFHQPAVPQRFTVLQATRLLIERVERSDVAKFWWTSVTEESLKDISSEVKKWVRDRYHLGDNEINQVLYLTWKHFRGQPEPPLPPPEPA